MLGGGLRRGYVLRISSLTIRCGVIPLWPHYSHFFNNNDRGRCSVGVTFFSLGVIILRIGEL